MTRVSCVASGWLFPPAQEVSIVEGAANYSPVLSAPSGLTETVRDSWRNKEKCPRYNQGIYLTDFVQSHVERLSKIGIVLPYDNITNTAFSMTFDSPGFCDDCVFKKSVPQGGFKQFSCEVTFSAASMFFRRTSPYFYPFVSLETLELQIANVSANAEVNLLLYKPWKPSEIHITRLKFPNLSNELLKKAANNIEKCPRHRKGIYLTDIVQSYVEGLSLIKTTLLYDEISQTVFWMLFNSGGFSDDCVFKRTFREGDFSQFSCKITFPFFTIQVYRETLGHVAEHPSLATEAGFDLYPEFSSSSLPDLLHTTRGGTLVHNLSSTELTKEQVQVLRHDASFNTAEAKPVKMIAAVESAVINQTEAAEETKNLIRHHVSFLLMTQKPREIVPKVERDALRELEADRDIVIVPADKGRSTVVLDRTDYLQKANNLLEDRQFYVPCEGNPVETLTREINATLLAVETSGAIRPTDRRMARAQEKVNIGMGLH
ncbi:hypothetical protein SprV_0702385100 [Sparganum proliferum]